MVDFACCREVLVKLISLAVLPVWLLNLYNLNKHIFSVLAFFKEKRFPEIAKVVFYVVNLK